MDVKRVQEYCRLHGECRRSPSDGDDKDGRKLEFALSFLWFAMNDAEKAEVDRLIREREFAAI